jgi:flagellar protein FlaG
MIMSIQSIGVSAQPGQLLTASGVNTAQTGAVQVPSSSSSTTPSNIPAQPPTTSQVNKAVQDLNKSVQTSTPGLEFSVDPTSNRMVVKVVDQETNQVLMQIPSEEVIDMSQSLDKLQGLLIKLKA